jgi:hypothetical protein
MAVFTLLADCTTSAWHSMISERDNETHNHTQPSEMLRSSEKQENIKETNDTLQNEKENKLADRM